MQNEGGTPISTQTAPCRDEHHRHGTQHTRSQHASCTMSTSTCEDKISTDKLPLSYKIPPSNLLFIRSTNMRVCLSIYIYIYIWFNFAQRGKRQLNPPTIQKHQTNSWVMCHVVCICIQWWDGSTLFPSTFHSKILNDTHRNDDETSIIPPWLVPYHPPIISDTAHSCSRSP